MELNLKQRRYVHNRMSEQPQPITANTAKHSRRRLTDAVILIVAWAVVLFAVQEYTTSSNYPLST